MGYAVGAALVAALGYALAFQLDAASYVVSAVLLLGLPTGRRHQGPEAVSIVRLLSGSSSVLRSIWRNKTLRVNLLLAVVCLTVVMMNLPNAYALVLQVFGGNAFGLMDLEVLTSCGLILGGLIFSSTRTKTGQELVRVWLFPDHGLLLHSRQCKPLLLGVCWAHRPALWQTLA